MSPAQKLKAVREAGDVQRWHTMPHHGDASLARHQWGVAVLLVELVPGLGMNLLKAGLYHDTPERWSGDIPLPARLDLYDLKAADAKFSSLVNERLGLEFELDEVEKAWLRFCDNADALLWANDQVRMGNRNCENAVKGLRSALIELAHKLDELDQPGHEAYSTVAAAVNMDRLPEHFKELN